MHNLCFFLSPTMAAKVLLLGTSSASNTAMQGLRPTAARGEQSISRGQQRLEQLQQLGFRCIEATSRTAGAAGGAAVWQTWQ